MEVLVMVAMVSLREVLVMVYQLENFATVP